MEKKRIAAQSVGLLIIFIVGIILFGRYALGVDLQSQDTVEVYNFPDFPVREPTAIVMPEDLSNDSENRVDISTGANNTLLFEVYYGDDLYCGYEITNPEDQAQPSQGFSFNSENCNGLPQAYYVSFSNFEGTTNGHALAVNLNGHLTIQK